MARNYKHTPSNLDQLGSAGEHEDLDALRRECEELEWLKRECKLEKRKIAKLTEE